MTVLSSQPLKFTEPLPGPSDRDVALIKPLGSVLYDVFDLDLLSGGTSFLHTRPDPAGNRALIKHLRKLSNGWRFALSAAFKAERIA